MITCFDSFDEDGGQGWQAHPAFKGVHLKALVTGSRTQGKFSAHLVRIEPGCSIGLHDHPDHWELHEVVDGAGTCSLAGRDVAYEPGVCEVMPQGEKHSVAAGEKGLKLLAKFVPALL